MAEAGRSTGSPISEFLVKLAAPRDLNNLPTNRQTPLMRKLLANIPHNPGCVSAVLGDMIRAILQAGWNIICFTAQATGSHKAKKH